MNNENSVFDDFKAEGSPAHLRRLLLAHEDRVYNICFQVLRHRQDAEDAAQEVLMELASGAAGLPDSSGLRKWIYRVCLHTAIDHERKRRRIASGEARLAMTRPATSEGDDHRALHEGLRQLDDESRSLLLEHYFDKNSLSDMAERQRCSKSVIWERLDRARERLRQKLATLGFSILIPDLRARLDSIEAMPAPPGLHDWILGSTASSVALGGVFMTVKQSIWGVAIAALLVLSVSVISLVALRPTSRPHAGDRSRQDAEGPTSNRAKDSERNRRIAVAPKQSPGAPEPSSAAMLLKSRLDQYRKKLDQEFPQRSVMKAAGNAAYLWKVSKWKIKELQGIKEEILAEPGALLEFFRADVAGDYIGEILLIALLAMQLNGNPATDEYYFRSSATVDASTLPPELLEGLKALLTSGSRAQVGEIMEFAGGLQGVPSEFAIALRSLIRSSDSDVQVMAIDRIAQRGLDFREPPSKDEAALLRQYAQDPGNEQRALSAVAALVFSRPSSYDTWLLEIAETSSSWAVSNQALVGLIWDAGRRGGGGDSAFTNRVLEAITQIIERRPTREQCGTWINDLVTKFPLDRTIPLLKRITPATHTSDLVDRAKAVVAAFESGNTNRGELSALLGPVR